MSEIPKLLARQRELMKRESILQECLKIVRSERNKLQVEHLQLESMIANLSGEKISSKDEFGPPASKVFKPLDFDCASKVNSQSIDLSITNSLNDMLEGKFYVDLNDEEFEEEDEGCSEDEYALTLQL